MKEGRRIHCKLNKVLYGMVSVRFLDVRGLGFGSLGGIVLCEGMHCPNTGIRGWMFVGCATY